MKTSTEIKNISKALIAAHKKIGHAMKDKTNPHFKSTYATLESVIDASKDALSDNELMVAQTTKDDNILVTTLIHSSGEFLQSEMKLILQKNDMQGLGSALSYARRYSLAAILNISQTDDDGNEASQVENKSPKAPFSEKKKSMIPENPGDYTVKFGKKFIGKKLKDIAENDHFNMISWLDNESKKSGKPIQGDAAEYVEVCNKYLSELAELPKLDDSEQIPF